MNTMHTPIRMTRLLTVILLTLFLTSCDSLTDFGDTNTDPTQASSISSQPGFALASIQIGTTGSRYEMWRSNLIYSELIAQHLSTSVGYWVGGEYALNPAYAASLYDVNYSGGPNGQPILAVVKNVESLVNTLEGDSKQKGELAAARIWRALIYQRLTDLYGAIPYTQAAQGFTKGNVAPRYTPQDSIYMGLHNELREAVGQLNQLGAGAGPLFAQEGGSGDLVYDGDISQWKKLANSLQLRLALRLVKVDPGRAQQWAEEAISSGVMTSNDDIAYMAHQSSGPGSNATRYNTNANSEVYASGVPKLSQKLVNYLKSHDDPRLGVYGAASDNPIGYPSGWNSGDLESNPNYPGSLDGYTNLNPVMRDANDPFFFQTYAEVEFMQAEAAARGWSVSGSAPSHYEKGVRAAMNYLSLYGADATIASSDIDDYLDNNAFDTSGSLSEQLEQINDQYWAAILLNGFEAWSNWRRSGYPKLDPAPVDDPDAAPTSDTGGEIMRRLIYPTSEADLNTDNYQAARSRQGITQNNVLTAPVWWDCGETASQCNTNGLGPQADPSSSTNGPGNGPSED